jgi:type IV secretion system protein VirB6
VATSTPVSPFGDLMKNIDKVIIEVFGNAAQGMSDYVVPIGWVMLGISLLLWSFLIFQGQSQTMAGYIKKLFVGLIIIQFAGSLYGTWVAAPLFALPDELSKALTHADRSTTALDELAGHIDDLVIGVAQASVSALKDLNFGGAAVLLAAMCAIAIAGCFLELSVVFNMVYAKIGLACLLSVGPFFVMCLMWKPISKWFYSWLNTVLYFSFLSAFSTLVMLMFMGIANEYMKKLSAALADAHNAGSSFAENVFSFLVTSMTPWGGTSGTDVVGSAGDVVSAQVNILSIALQLVLVFVPLALVAMETRTMVSSITGGSGGSFGSGMMNIVSTAWRGGMGRLGGGQ